MARRADAEREFGPRQRWWASTGTSLAIHVVVLVVLALVITVPPALQRCRPIEIAPWAADGDAASFVEPEAELAVEMVPPAGMPAPDPVERADTLFDEDALAAVATELTVAEPAAVVVPLEVDGVLAPIDTRDAGRGLSAAPPDGTRASGGPGGAGQGAGGFGGDVGRRLAKAGAQTGDIQVSLAWDDFNDLDLHVVAPSGEHVFFAHRWSACGGMLDVDMNAAGPATREPVENVFWPARAAPWGEYQVFVHHFARWDRADETAFEVHVLVNGEKRTYSGTVRAGQPPVPVAKFMKRGGAGQGME